MGKHITVILEVAVEVDRQRCAEAYGCEDTRPSVETFVKQRIVDGIKGTPEAPITVLNWS